MRVEDLCDFIRQAENITFITGSGASKSADIPLAGELIKRLGEDERALDELEARFQALLEQGA